MVVGNVMTFAFFLFFWPRAVENRPRSRYGTGTYQTHKNPSPLKKERKKEDSGDCTTVATQPRQLHYSNNLSKEKEKNSINNVSVLGIWLYAVRIHQKMQKKGVLSVPPQSGEGLREVNNTVP